MSGVPGMPLPSWAPELRPCGTLAAYRRHLRRGEPVDESCRQAVTRSWHDRRAGGYERAFRAGRGPVHLGGAGKSLCGKRPKLLTDIVHEATCKTCQAVYRRHARPKRNAPGVLDWGWAA